mmetsp:Transcript_16819/g.48896  ORF Transcript_16819/g.48896 Transcript_16819/m.48896 type:complete len:247 (-) Transcript_16819:62-802(-)
MLVDLLLPILLESHIWCELLVVAILDNLGIVHHCLQALAISPHEPVDPRQAHPMHQAALERLILISEMQLPLGRVHFPLPLPRHHEHRDDGPPDHERHHSEPHCCQDQGRLVPLLDGAARDVGEKTRRLCRRRARPLSSTDEAHVSEDLELGAVAERQRPKVQEILAACRPRRVRHGGAEPGLPAFGPQSSLNETQARRDVFVLAQSWAEALPAGGARQGTLSGGRHAEDIERDGEQRRAAHRSPI